MTAYHEEFGALHKAAHCGASHATAGGTGDATAVTGASIDRLGYASCSLVIDFKAVLAEDATLTYAVEYQESSDNSNWDTAVALQAATTAATGGSGGSTEQGLVQFDLNLRAKKRYIRFNFTPNLSAANTDTAISAAVAILGGADKLPAV
jgi:hypothetical protein